MSVYAWLKKNTEREENGRRNPKEEHIKQNREEKNIKQNQKQEISKRNREEKNIKQNQKEESVKRSQKEDTNVKKQKQIPANKKTVKTTYTKQELISRLKEMVDKKYALEQTMAGLTGGKTGVVALKAQISEMWDLSNWEEIELYETMFYRKAQNIKNSYSHIKKIQADAENKKKQRRKGSITAEEAELYDLIAHIQYDDYYKKLIEENDCFLKKLKRKKRGEDENA